ncbi:MAG: hypothetical protein GXO80_01440 [Chlorobi bacterium]|nr:hypothetical protein [Chlorobiota bacterium]
MKKKIITFIVLLIFAVNSFSQIETGKHFVLNKNLSGQNKTYIARDYIKLTGGFRYTAQPGKTFIGRIDPSLIFDTDYGDTQTPFSTDLPVGSLPGSVNVSPSGAATYAIPIALPPGTAGMMPGLSIVYNSQSGDGMLGRGWTIGGFSAITRVPTTYYHDGYIDGVDFDDNDRFALDGQRLIVTKSVGDIIEYHTEIESFSKITTMIKPLATNPPEFEVNTKNGMTLEYGYTEDSRIQAPGKNDVMYWLLNKVYDTKGNYYTIKYKEENGEFYPLEIKYTGNTGAGLAAYNKIKFYYTRKTDKSNAFVAGSEFKSTVLLSDINIYNNDKLIRKYSFTYSYNMFSRLSEIKLFENKNSKINTTKIEWGNETTAIQENNINLKGTGDYYPGDYNGDGKTDIMILVKLKDSDGVLQFDENGRQKYEKEVIYTSNGNNSFSLFYSNDIGPGDGYYTEVYPGDFNGDGITDIFSITFNPNTNKFVHAFMLSNKSDNSFSYMFPSIPQNAYSFGKQIKVGDFDGNGKTDVFIFHTIFNYPSDISFNYNIYTLNANNNGINTMYNNNNGLPLLKSYVTDFNGNGVSDLMFIYSYGNISCKIQEQFFNTNTADYEMKDLYTGGYPTQNHRLFFGDFNGDGKTDIMTWIQSVGWEIRFSNGNGFYGSNLTTPDFDKNADPEAENNNNNYVVSDFNGDGKDDILEQYIIWNSNETSSKSRFNVFYTLYNSGNEINYKKESKDIVGVWPYIQQYRPNVDTNGDGKQDVVLNTGYFDNYRKVIYFHPNEQKHLVKSITDGYNNKTEFEYKPLTDASVYAKGSGAVFPVSDFQGPLYVVKNLTAPDGIGGTIRQNYFYENAKIHRQGKGFLGFMKITAKNTKTNIITENVFDYNRSWFNTFPVSSKTYYSNTSHLISSSSGTTVTQALGNKRIFVYTSASSQTDLLSNITVNSNFQYDDNGNITRSYVDYDGEGNIETLYQNYVNAGAWCPSKPSKTIVKKQSGTKPLYTRISEFEYYSNGLLKKSIADPDDAQNKITNEYWYNSCGLAVHTKTSAPGQTSKNSYLYYDDKYRFLTGKKDPLGFVSHKTYDPETGNVLTETDINGHTTKFKYDAFGTLTETELPDGTKSYQSTHWYTGSAIAHARTYTVTSADGEAPIKEFFDILSRKIHTETKGFNDETIISETKYNGKGQIDSIYEPHFAGENANYSTFYYDSYGRQTRIVSPVGTTSYTYNGKTTSLTVPDGKTSSKTVNALGQTITATDNGGTITYNYNSAGLPVTITAPGNAIVTISYDNYGNKTSISDPDAGTIFYEYDAFSNITKQKDANNNVDSMQYDIAGRLIEKSGPDGTTYYNYDTAPFGKGMLASETYNGNTKTYNYDNLSRLLSVSETFEGEEYTYSYEYDNLGRISKTTYPNGFAYTKHYKPNGSLEQIKRADNGALISKTEKVNAYGQVTQLLKGNDIRTYKTYDNVSHLPESVQSGKFQDFEYNFDARNGNLLSREERIHGNIEIFSYDNLDRLTQINTNGNIFNINYDNTGNITNKSDAGAYAYDATKIHAVTQVTGDVYLPSFNQDIKYTLFNKVEEITEGDIHLNFTYGLNNQRKKTILTENGHIITRTKYFFGSYEKTIYADGTITEYCWLPGGAIYKTTNGTSEMLYTYTDHLGSITHITDARGKLIAELSYDAWGRLRDSVTWEYTTDNNQLSIINYRGYTGHEHLTHFGIINMNGRLYDPVLGRFLSPDNYVQAPDFTQNFNRYSYVLNNPLKYTDPSGEFSILMLMKPLYFAGVFVTNLASNALNGYNTSIGGELKNSWNIVNEFGNAFQFSIYQNDNINLTAGLDPFALGVSANFGFQTGGFNGNVSAGIGLIGGWNVNAGIQYSPRDFQFGIGGGIGSNYKAWGANATYEGWGGGFYRTYYGNAAGPDEQSNSQIVGSPTLYFNHNSLTVSNDTKKTGGDGNDRWRSGAMEVQVGDFVAGFYILQNDPESEGLGADLEALGPNGKKHENPNFGVWNNGQTYRAPFYVGYRFGNRIERIGYSHKYVQQFFQNYLIHRHGFGLTTATNQNLYASYDKMYTGIWGYSGWYNPYSIWGR